MFVVVVCLVHSQKQARWETRSKWGRFFFFLEANQGIVDARMASVVLRWLVNLRARNGARIEEIESCVPPRLIFKAKLVFRGIRDAFWWAHAGHLNPNRKLTRTEFKKRQIYIENNQRSTMMVLLTNLNWRRENSTRDTKVTENESKCPLIPLLLVRWTTATPA